MFDFHWFLVWFLLILALIFYWICGWIFMCCMVAVVGWWWVAVVEWSWVDGWLATQMKRKRVWDEEEEEEEERRRERERVWLWERIEYNKIMICKVTVNNHVNMLSYCSKFEFYPIIHCLMRVSYRLCCVNFCTFSILHSLMWVLLLAYIF